MQPAAGQRVVVQNHQGQLIQAQVVPAPQPAPILLAAQLLANRVVVAVNIPPVPPPPPQPPAVPRRVVFVPPVARRHIPAARAALLALPPAPVQLPILQHAHRVVHVPPHVPNPQAYARPNAFH
jgi:hypothetical protein